MEAKTCVKCGGEFTEWVEFCPHCSEPVEGYARPAGFWIRVGAYIIDTLVFIPLIVLGIWNYYSLKSTGVLILGSLPGFLYKPLMEAFCGATLGKMSVGIKVVDRNGNRLGLFNAYARAFPFLLSAGIGLTNSLMIFSSPQFQSATTMQELAQVKPEPFLQAVGMLANLLLLVDCVTAAFTRRKRALHDMLADSYCVYKGPAA